MDQLHQPFLSTEPAPNPPDKRLTLDEFLKLLEEEEDYWGDEKYNTRLIITRLRKIFYDKWGWDTFLIPAAAKISNRYLVTVVDGPEPETEAKLKESGAKLERHYKKNATTNKVEFVARYRSVVYRDTDKVYPQRAGTTPWIYKNEHQEVLLPDGYYCKIGHVLGGLDALNYPTVVGLMGKLNFLKLGPHVDSNCDVCCWLTDIASSACDFFFTYLGKDRTPLNTEQEQHFIDIDAPGSKMLGDLDPYVIANKYKIGATKGMRITEILRDYYYGSSGSNGVPFRNERCRYFCDLVGLKGWNGKEFENEKEWLAKYHQQLRDDICFNAASLTNINFTNIWHFVQIWLFNDYQDVLKIDTLLNLWLNDLKEEVKKEIHKARRQQEGKQQIPPQVESQSQTS